MSSALMNPMFPAPPFSADEATPGWILVVDDDASVRRLVTMVLTRVGHIVTEAGGTDEALARLACEPHDVALIDLDMPERDGLDLLDAMKMMGASAVPVLLTGTTNVGAAVGGMKRGAFDYLSKPVERDTLQWTVARALEVARARRRERSLERVASEWTSTFDACPDLLLVLDADGRVLRANEAVVRRTGANPTGLVGRSVTDLFTDRLGTAVLTCVKGLPDGVVLPTRLFDPHLSGHFLVSVTPIRTSDGTPPVSVVVARDVTDLVRGEEVRARLLRQLMAAQEDERARIARELHDGVGQALVSLAVGLTTVTGAVIDRELRERVQRLKDVASETLDEIRRLAQGLRPTVLDDLGLAAALARLTEVFTRVHRVRADFLVPADRIDRIPTEMESAVYRIVQEALTNVAKHAHARTVDVVLEVTDRSVRVSVTDDGVGFATADRSATEVGLGLSGMRERAVMLGGTCRVESALGLGTTIDVDIPIAEAVQ